MKDLSSLIIAIRMFYGCAKYTFLCTTGLTTIKTSSDKLEQSVKYLQDFGAALCLGFNVIINQLSA